ncbi:hypothetical protein LguiB_000321 [Lonicera macranthoides]
MFVRQVNRVLKLHKSPTIEEFRVCVELDETYKSDIEEWVKFTLTRRVQKLELFMAWHNIGPFPSSRRPYSLEFPSNTCCTSEFKSLKSLHLKGVDVSGQVLENILATCPFLERLAVRASQELKTLKVAGPSLVLKYLEISWCNNLDSIEICILTNLVRFEYWAFGTNLRLNNVPRLVELSIAGRVIRQNMLDFLPKFSSCFARLETLELDVNQVEEFGGFQHASPPKFPNLRKLVLKSKFVGGYDKCLLGYTSLIKASPLLQKFVLLEYWNDPRINHFRRVTKAEKWRHERLEEVEFDGYYGSKCDRELVGYFMENATALKRIIIRPCDQRCAFVEQQLPISREMIMIEKAARRRAKEQLQGIIPPGIELIIL